MSTDKQNQNQDGQAAGVAVVVDARTAYLIRRVFLPQKTRKMRNATPEVVQAALDFIAAGDRCSLLSASEWRAIYDALSFTAEHAGCVSDAHNRAADIVRRALRPNTESTDAQRSV